MCNFLYPSLPFLPSFIDLSSDFIIVTLYIHCVRCSSVLQFSYNVLYIMLLFISVTSDCIKMAQEHTVSFKVFLQNDGVNEVRRFGIDRDVVSSCTYLREKLRAVFPSLHGRDFTVAWRGNQSCSCFYYLRATVVVKLIFMDPCIVV